MFDRNAHADAFSRAVLYTQRFKNAQLPMFRVLDDTEVWPIALHHSNFVSFQTEINVFKISTKMVSVSK